MGGSREADEVMAKFESVQKLKEQGIDIESDPEDNEDEIREKKEEEEKEQAEALKEKEQEQQQEEEESYDEREFQFDSYLKKFFTNTIVQVYLRVLELYKYNPLRINHCVITLLHRLSTLQIGELGYGADENDEDRKAYGETILFQVAYMDLFERILEDKSIQKDRRYKDVLGFSKSTVRHFIRALQANPLWMVEAMFWRSRRAHVGLQNGYRDSSGGSGGRGKSKNGNNDDMTGKNT